MVPNEKSVISANLALLCNVFIKTVNLVENLQQPHESAQAGTAVASNVKWQAVLQNRTCFSCS